MLPVRCRAILRWQPFSSILLRTLISWPYQVCSFYNFRARLHQIFVIWPKYTTRAISRDSRTATLSARPISHANIPGLSKSAHFKIFTRDRFQYSLFGLNMLPVRFHTILRWQHFSRAQSCSLTSRPSREHYFYNFRA